MFYTVHDNCIYILLYICVIIFLFSPFNGVDIVLDNEIKKWFLCIIPFVLF